MQMQTVWVCVCARTRRGKPWDKESIHVLYVDSAILARHALMSPACVIYHTPCCLGFGPSHLVSFLLGCTGRPVSFTLLPRITPLPGTHRSLTHTTFGFQMLEFIGKWSDSPALLTNSFSVFDFFFPPVVSLMIIPIAGQEIIFPIFFTPTKRLNNQNIFTATTLTVMHQFYDFHSWYVTIHISIITASVQVSFFMCCALIFLSGPSSKTDLQSRCDFYLAE